MEETSGNTSLQLDVVPDGKGLKMPSSTNLSPKPNQTALSVIPRMRLKRERGKATIVLYLQELCEGVLKSFRLRPTSQNLIKFKGFPDLTENLIH